MTRIKGMRFTLVAVLVVLLIFSGVACISCLKQVKAESAILYSEDFEDLETTSSADEIYQNSGMAGATRSIVENEGGFTQKSLKAIYDFWPQADGGWQKEGLYINENFTFRADQSKSYEISFDLSFFGSVEQAIFIIMPPSGQVDSQIIYKPADSSYVSQELGSKKIFENVSVENDGGVWHTKILFNGFDDQFKFMINMHSSDPDNANIAKDTGVYIDNVVMQQVQESSEGEFRTLFKMDFNDISLDTSGSDAMYRATGFAGGPSEDGAISVVENGIDASRCMKVIYKFNETDGWQLPGSEAYLDSSRTSNTAATEEYRFSMQIKPFGNIKDFAVIFNYPDATSETIYLLEDGNIQVDKLQQNGKLIDAQCEYDKANNIYNLEVYLYGTGGYFFNNFRICSSDPAVSNSEANTGFYLDSYLFEQKKQETAAGLNIKEYFFNKADSNDFSSAVTFVDIQNVTINNEPIDAGKWEFSNSILTINKSVFEALPQGEHSLKVIDSSGNSDEAVIYIDEIELGTVYAIDFSAMPELGGDQAANDAFFQNSYMDPGLQKIYTVDDNGNRYIKFQQDGEVSDQPVSMFQFNPGEARLHMLNKGKWHSVKMDWKPQNASILSIRGLAFDGTTSKDLFSMELDFLSGKRVDSAEQSYNASWRITAKDNGWYELCVTFFYDGDDFSDNSAAYLVFSSAKEDANTAWLLDNIVVSSQLLPELISSRTDYDIATGQNPYYIVNLYDKFEITDVVVDEKSLTIEKDYSISTTPNGYIRIDLTKEFGSNYNKDESFVLNIKVSDGSSIVSEFNVIDTSILLPEMSVTYDKAEGQDLGISIDFAGYAIERISLNGTDLLGMEYRLDTDNDKLVFVYEYLRNLETGEYTYTVYSVSGASASFTIDLMDTTPVIEGELIFDKSKDGDFKINVDLFGKAITEIKVGDSILAADKYSEENGVLTIASEALAGLAVGEYDFTLKTNASITVKLTVTDVVAEFSGTYTIERGNDLVITVDLHGKDIIQIVVDGLILSENEWNYKDGKLTILAPIFDEIAAGEKSLSVTTTGGTSSLNFTLEESSQGGSCNASLQPVCLLAAMIILFAAAIVLRRRSVK